MADVVLAGAFVADVGAGEFVDGVVCEVHVEVVEVGGVGGAVFAGGEAAEAFFVKEDSHRINPNKQNIYPQVKLQIIDQLQLMHISLNDRRLLQTKVFQIPRQKDPPTLSSRLRLRNKRFATPPLLRVFPTNGPGKLRPKISIFCRQEPCLGEELVVFGEELLHAHKIPGQVILTGQGVHARKVVNSLIGFHPVQFLALDAPVCPEDVPLVVGSLGVTGEVGPRETHFEHASGDVSDDMVARLRHV